MNKFNRNYELLIETRDGKLLKITRPFTVEFEVYRNSFSSANICSIRVTNLNANNRNQIRKDQYETTDLRTITFSAGYGDKLSIAFKGNINQAWSVREGTRMVTQIESYDGGFAYINGITDSAYPGNSPQQSIIDSLASSLPGVTVGAIGSFPGSIGRGNAYNGQTTSILTELTGGGFFIDNGKAYCLNDNECVSSNIPLVNAQSGLLGTPVKEQTYINFDMLFEPNLIVGQLIRLETLTAEVFNGVHKVISLRHSGVISDAVAGSAITSVGLLPGRFTPIPARS